MVFFLGFILGILAGAGFFLGYGYYHLKKIDKIKTDLINQLKTKSKEMVEKKNTIKERLIKAADLAQTQLKLRAVLDQPSKNALHSRYKNGLIGEINDLERQKIDILKTVLAEGFDPSITVMSENGTKEQMPLSQYVAETDPDGAPKPPSDGPKKAGKFVVHKGGKDDGTTH